MSEKKYKHLDDYLEEKTSQQLQTDTDVNFSNKRKQRSGRVAVNNLQLIPSLKSATLTVKAKTKTNKNTYDTVIVYEHVDYVSRFKTGAVEIVATDGNQYYVDPIPDNRDIKVACSCLDFYYMFAPWNSKDDALVGTPPPSYVKKTNLPLRNPKEVSGLCKHLMKLKEQMKLNKITK